MGMLKRTGFAATALMAAVTTLGACAAGPNYTPPSPAALNVPPAWSVTGAPAAQIDLSVWWRQFHDPLLVDLIARATADNLDIAVAKARLLQAREQLVQTRASLYPSLSGSLGDDRTVVRAPSSTLSVGPTSILVSGNSDTTSLSLGLDASWQADLFGGTRRSIEAAKASRDSALYNLVAVRTSVAGEVATNYIQARLAQARLAIARDSLKDQGDNLQITEWRRQAGLASSIDVEQARAQRAQTEATVPLLENDFTSAVNQLALLTGQAPGAMRDVLVTAAPIPRGPNGVAVGIPVDTLRQRPDVRVAERNLAAATAQIGVAQAALYPSLSLTGSLTGTAATLGQFGRAGTGELFATLSQTIFDAGRLRSQLRSARVGADSAFATYKKTVLSGLADVENAIQALDSAKSRQTSLGEAADASNDAAILARSQYRVGLTDFLTLLQSEQSLLQARDSLASAQADQATALVQLYLALGGGWQPASPQAIGPETTAGSS
jgi:NodT family efflux transporter outer membrane factor (OMF) lipoprotein